MSGIMYLGNQMVSPVIIQGEEKAFNVDGYDWLGEINAQGELVAPTKDINPVFNGVKEINTTVLANKFRNDTRVKSVSFPDLESINCDNALINFGDTALSSISFPKLVSISGNNALNSAFWGTGLTVLDFPELQTISGNNTLLSCFRNIKIEELVFQKLKYVLGRSTLQGAFSYNNNLKTVSFPALEQIGSDYEYSPINGTFMYCENLEEAYFQSLTNILNYGFASFFLGCTKLKTVSFPNLKTVGIGGLSSCFQNSGIETLEFPELLKIDLDYSLGYMCSNCTNLKTISFPKLTTIENSTTDEDGCFEDMLYGCSNVTVHFPSELEAKIGDWDDVLAGFGGTNTTILYDL